MTERFGFHRDMEPILRSTPPGGESERAFFAFFTLDCRKHTLFLADQDLGRYIIERFHHY